MIADGPGVYELAPGRQPWYPELGPADSTILTWHWEHGLTADRAWYGVRVGEEAEALYSQEAGWVERYVRANYRKRVDLVLLVGRDLWCVEVKPFASYVALGQVLVYAELLRAAIGAAGAVVPVVCTDRLDRDVRGVVDRLGVRVIEAGESLVERPNYPT